MADKKQAEQWEPSNWDELFPGRFLKCGHLDGREVELRIARVYGEMIDEKPASVFRIDPVPGIKQVDFGLNKTNGLCLKQMFGPLMSDWRGKRFVVHESKVEHGREKGRPTIRICASPDIPRDVTCVIDFHTKMIRPFTILVRSTASAPADSRGLELLHMIQDATTQDSASAAWDECKRDHAAMMLTDKELDQLKRAFAVQYKKLGEQP
jgi:hypothetical protein